MALLVALGAAMSAEQASGDGASEVAQASKKNCKKKKTAKARKKCKKRGAGGGSGGDGKGGDGPDVTPAFSLVCPPGPVSGSSNVTISGRIWPLNSAPIEIDYQRYNKDSAPYYFNNHLDLRPAADGTWSFTFVPNISATPYAGTWTEQIFVQNRGSTVVEAVCEFGVSWP